MNISTLAADCSTLLYRMIWRLLLARLRLADRMQRGVDPEALPPGKELTYVLEGTGVTHQLGKPSMPTKPGFTVSAYSPADKPAYVHWATNTSKTDIQRWLITVVTPKGYPMIIPVE